MFSPVKAITAGAIIFALGGAVTVTVNPFDREGGGVPGAESSEPVTVVVPGTDQWTDTGIDLKIDDTVSIEADGEITPSVAGVPLHGPDGVPDGRGRTYNLEGLEEPNHNSLIGRIGEDGAPFPVGSQLQSKADTDGRLFLGVNDIDVGNNAGEFTVTVTVNP